MPAAHAARPLTGVLGRPNSAAVHLIKSMGKVPVQRDTLYRDVRVWS
jgi:2-iminoacetate synthase ThiH